MLQSVSMTEASCAEVHCRRVKLVQDAFDLLGAVQIVCSVDSCAVLHGVQYR